mgnify:CR=1 FL=1
MISKKIMLGMGIFLTADGIISFLWATQDNCMNNSPFGNLVRIVRALIGIYLIYRSRED